MSNKYHFHVGKKDEADRLVKRFHYSKRPTNAICVGTFHLDGGLFGDYGEAIAACYFANPPTRWSTPLLELTRLVRHEEYRPPLTSLISKTLKHLDKKNITNLVVSFADWTQEHHGGIYQACSWNYHGKREQRVDGLIINGKFFVGRTCNANWGTSSPTKLKELRPDWDIVPHYDEGKHLYWKALNKNGEREALKLGLEKNKYTKPMQGDLL